MTADKVINTYAHTHTHMRGCSILIRANFVLIHTSAQITGWVFVYMFTADLCDENECIFYEFDGQLLFVLVNIAFNLEHLA